MNSRRLRLKAVSAKKHRRFNFFTESELPGAFPNAAEKHRSVLRKLFLRKTERSAQMKWDKIAGVRRELKKMAREAMGREYIFSVTFACMMNLIPWMVHKFLGSHWAVGIISSTIRRCGFAGLSIPLLCFSLRIILRNMLIVLPISIFVQQNMRVGAQDSLYQIFGPKR